jgi:antitoxin VapB
MTKAKLFVTGGSQAVRLPAEFRFDGDEVDTRRDATTGDVVLPKPVVRIIPVTPP